ncbi:MAG TPA: glycosyltransferase family 2 protein [Bryobacteraceae bacterium]|nr:glycosyltransferase family 2 protein [Bryobacteraceae bacterium]
MSIAAVIPQWNRAELLQELLQSLGRQTRGFEEIIVADNGSSDDSMEIARKAGARVIELGKNLGFAAAVNRGIAAAKAEWIAILNNDVTLARDWAARLMESAESNEAWFASGKILKADDRSIIDGTFDELSRGACAWRCGEGKPDSPLWNKGRAVRFVPMTAAIFRRELFEEIGGLDERFGSYLEDVDFGIRCAMAGRGGYYEPEAVAWHRGSATLGAWNSDTVCAIARNQILLAAKHFRGEPRWPIVAGQLLWGLVALRHGRVFAYVRGKLAGLWVARRLTGDRNSAAENRLREIVEASERDILTLTRATGMGWYWRAYFWLLRR